VYSHGHDDQYVGIIPLIIGILAMQSNSRKAFAIGSEGLVGRAASLADRYSQNVARHTRKTQGQFFTPAAVARFIAAMIDLPRRRCLRVLDPGAGTGTLSAALCERLATDTCCRTVELHAYETCPALVTLLRSTLEDCRRTLARHGKTLHFTIGEEDFVTACAYRLGRGLLHRRGKDAWREYDVAISNPPYGKIRKSDPRSALAARVVKGQPNIYALFMAVAAQMLRPNGILAFIVPRSFASGEYFKRFRAVFFSKVRPRKIHVFGSRRAAFGHEGVLQENLVIVAQRYGVEAQEQKRPSVWISSSRGIKDLDAAVEHRLPLHRVLNEECLDGRVCLPTSPRDAEILRLVEGWPDTFATLGLQVSTGPVVAFRAKQFHRIEGAEDTVPFLWMHHVRRMETVWPIADLNKPQHFVATDRSEKLLLPLRNYVLLRRFSAKEESRRITAAPLRPSDVESRSVALENHLNYIARPDEALSPAEAAGIAAVLNLSVLDRYFRTFNGNTQVAAAEISSLPLPDIQRLREIGERTLGIRDPSSVEAVANSMLDIPDHLAADVPEREE